MGLTNLARDVEAEMSNMVLAEEYLLKYLMVKLAPVLVRLKPSCLLSLCNCKMCGGENHYDLWKVQKENTAQILEISFKELRDTPRGKQVLFYNPEILFGTITQSENLAYLERFGYSSRCTLKDFLELLKARFYALGASSSSGKNVSFPHEIGIFLGYPLKDVKGFIEKGSLPLAKIGRWQVFGESEESIQLMNIHKKAEEVFLGFIKNRSSLLSFTLLSSEHLRSFIERVSAHFGKFTKHVMAIQVS